MITYLARVFVSQSVVLSIEALRCGDTWLADTDNGREKTNREVVQWAMEGENTLVLNGKPIIAWSIEAVQSSAYVDRCILSSDDNGIIKIAREWRCDLPFVRPALLAQDTSSISEVLVHALEQIDERFDYLVLI